MLWTLLGVLSVLCASELSSVRAGVVYKTIITNGTGSVPKPGDTVFVHYTGNLTTGVKFDSSRDRNAPFSFKLGAGEVISGWDAGVATMREGERAQLEISPEDAYGTQGIPDVIPPSSTLLFDIELLEIRRGPSSSLPSTTGQASSAQQTSSPDQSGSVRGNQPEARTFEQSRFPDTINLVQGGSFRGNLGQSRSGGTQQGISSPMPGGAFDGMRNNLAETIGGGMRAGSVQGMQGGMDNRMQRGIARGTGDGAMSRMQGGISQGMFDGSQTGISRTMGGRMQESMRGGMQVGLRDRFRDSMGGGMTRATQGGIEGTRRDMQFGMRDGMSRAMGSSVGAGVGGRVQDAIGNRMQNGMVIDNAGVFPQRREGRVDGGIRGSLDGAQRDWPAGVRRGPGFGIDDTMTVRGNTMFRRGGEMDQFVGRGQRGQVFPTVLPSALPMRPIMARPGAVTFPRFFGPGVPPFMARRFRQRFPF